MDEAAPQTFAHGFGAIGNIELPKQAFEVSLDRVFRNAEHLAQLAIPKTLPEQFEDLVFAPREVHAGGVLVQPRARIGLTANT